MTKFKVGDVVRLKSGGPKMTVVAPEYTRHRNGLEVQIDEAYDVVPETVQLVEATTKVIEQEVSVSPDPNNNPFGDIVRVGRTITAVQGGATTEAWYTVCKHGQRHPISDPKEWLVNHFDSTAWRTEKVVDWAARTEKVVDLSAPSI